MCDEAIDAGPIKEAGLKEVEKNKFDIFVDSITLTVNGKAVTITTEDIKEAGKENSWFFRRIREHEDVLQVIVAKLLKDK